MLINFSINWEDLAEAYLAQQTDEAKLVEAQAERDSAVQDRETAQRRLAEQRKAVQQAELKTIKELHKMHGGGCDQGPSGA